MDLRQKLNCIERACQGRKVDVVLGGVPHPELEDKGNIVTRDLASVNRGLRHDREKLRLAVLEQL